jgi:hypothetical protein
MLGLGGIPIAFPRGSTPFDPTQMPGFVDRMRGDSASVSAWTDTGTGALAFAQATGARQPTITTNINGKQTVTFNGSKWFDAGNVKPTTGNKLWTMAVFKAAAIGAEVGIISKYWTGGAFHLGGSEEGDGKIQYFVNGSTHRALSNASMAGPAGAVIGYYDGGATPSTSLWVLSGGVATLQTVQGTTNVAFPTTSDLLAIGGLVDNGPTLHAGWNGDIGEIAMGNADPTPKVTQLAGYVLSYWGI